LWITPSGLEHNSEADVNKSDNKAPESSVTTNPDYPPVPPSDRSLDATPRKTRYTRDPGMFWISMGTLIISVGTLIAVIFYAWYARQQAISSNLTAQAATTQAGVADKAMLIGLRPYVQIGDPDSAKPTAEWVTKGDKRIGIKVYFWNAGSTPGFRLWVNGEMVPGAGGWGLLHHLEMQPVKNGPVTTWTPGTTIPARGVASVQIGTEAQIENEFTVAKSTHGFEVEGSFEYMNVFDEWCCESYCLTLDDVGRFKPCPAELRSAICRRADNVVNVCEQKGELKEW
jgi:hypothetical protein